MCVTHLSVQAALQFHEWRACSRWVWIWQQSWEHWRYQNSICILVQYWRSWRSVPSHPESPVTAGSVYCLCRVHGWQFQNLGSPQLCWEWRETSWWRRFLLNGCPGYRSGGCPQSLPGLLNKACLSVVYDAEHAKFAQPDGSRRLENEWRHTNGTMSRKGEGWVGRQNRKLLTSANISLFLSQKSPRKPRKCQRESCKRELISAPATKFWPTAQRPQSV